MGAAVSFGGLWWFFSSALPASVVALFLRACRLFGFLLTWPLPALWLVRCIPLTFLSLSVWDTVIVKISRFKDFPL